jgi:hypothetical protein
MGLDSDIYAAKGHGLDAKFVDIIEWRKRYEIQMWMHGLADSKGAEYEPQDGWYGPVVLTDKDLDSFREALIDGKFDIDSVNDRHMPEEEKNEILAVIEKAKLLMKDGYEILYSSSY